MFVTYVVVDYVFSAEITFSSETSTDRCFLTIKRIFFHSLTLFLQHFFQANDGEILAATQHMMAVVLNTELGEEMGEKKRSCPLCTSNFVYTTNIKFLFKYVVEICEYSDISMDSR